MSTDLCFLPALEILNLFKSRELSPVELMNAVIERAESVEPIINAFSYTHYDEAIALAKKAEQAYIKGTARPLEGIPFAVKDESHIAGKPTSNGSLFLKDFVPDDTTFVVERILDAGAIVHARTTTPEFSSAVFTWSKVWGVTRNPWNPEITPGGSTGGGAAALAAGSTILTNGSDIAGSIRVPASMCGLVGFKPPYGRNPENPPWNLEPYSHEGPLARTVDDCSYLQNIMSGPHPGDMVSLKPKLDLPSAYDSIAGKRIALSIDLGYKAVDPAVRNLIEKAAIIFQELGAIVEPVDLGWTDETLKATLDYLTFGMMGASLREYYANEPDKLANYNRWMVERGQRTTAADYARAAELSGENMARLAKIYETYDLLLTPAVALAGVPADFDYGSMPLEINGQLVNSKLGWVMSYPFNMLNRCPALVIPAGRTAENVPIGIQLVAPPYEDATCFQFASAYAAYKPDLFIGQTNYPSLNI
ncbi:MAG: amidase [Cellvibrionaceae bacterium]|jgi:amidase